MNALTGRLAAAACCVVLAACGQQESDGSARAAPARDAAAPAPGTPRRATACELVSAERMSAILGAPVTATDPSPGATGKTECSYAPPAGSFPMAQVGIEYGSAEAAMTAIGMLGRIEPGIANPYEGLGDYAAAVGPAVWIRKGDDLVTITVMGAAAPESAVKQVYERVASRL